MVSVYLNLSIFVVFLKNRNIISKIRKSKVTDYAALRGSVAKSKSLTGDGWTPHVHKRP